MKREEFNNILYNMNKTDLVKTILEEVEVSGSQSPYAAAQPAKFEGDVEPSKLTLDAVIYVSQETSSGEIKKFEFAICEVWLKPQYMYTIVNTKKERIESNFWILFYEKGTYYLKKGIKGPIGVHVHLKYKDKNEEN